MNILKLPKLGKIATAVVMVANASVAMVVFGPSLPALAATCGTGGTPWQLGTQSGGGSSGAQVLDTADNWNGGNACLKIGTNGVDFTVQSQTVNTSNLNPVAYPDTNIGCEGGYCTTTTHQRQTLPGVYGTIDPKLTATWVGPDNASGHKYDQLIDNQFSSDCTTDTNPTFDVNIAIYTDAVSSGTHGAYSNLGLANSTTGPTFTDSSGNVWYTYQVVSGTVHRTEFSAKTHVASVSTLDLGQFYTWAHNNGTGYMPTGECLRDLGVGFEPWTALTANTLGMSGVLIDP
jgi:hypothetical protein